MTFSFDSPANLDGIGMGISMSGMSAFGVSGSAIGGRIDDEERRKRLEAVVATLATRPGRVSQEGMERLSKRFDLGFDVDSRKDGRKTLMLAGKGMLLDVCRILHVAKSSLTTPRRLISLMTLSRTFV